MWQCWAEMTQQRGFPSSARGLAAAGVARLTGAARLRTRVEGDKVALTFDDGPDPEFTERIAGELERLGTRGTFFCLGAAAERRPDIVRSLVNDGHAVGSHSFSHPAAGTLGLRALLADYWRGRVVLEGVVGHPVRLFRPPQGATGWRGSSASYLAGLHPWLWSKDPQDWRVGSGVDEILGAVGTLTAGDVVLLHDGLADKGEPFDRSATLAALEPLVLAGKAAGLSFTTLDASSAR